MEVKNGKELVFGQYRPEEIMCVNESSLLTEVQKNFIYDFSVWIYRAVVVFYNDKRNDTSIVYHKNIEEIFRKGLEYSGKTFITTRKQYNGQVQVGKDYWLTIPPQTKDKFKMLRILDAVMRLKIEVTII